MVVVSAQAQKSGPGGVGIESSTAFYLFPGLPRITISEHGNIVSLVTSTGAGHVSSEGYVLCYGGTIAYDIKYLEAGFGPTTGRSCSGNTCIFTRNTSDGLLQLRHVITKSPSEERALNIEMTVTNRAGFSIGGITLRRQVDLDVDAHGTGGGSTLNRFASSELDSVTAWNAPLDGAGVGSAILLRHLRAVPASTTYAPKVTADFADTSCSPPNIAASGEVRGDYGASIQYNIGTLLAGRSVSAKIQYQRN
jgi:hypothetical protein